jgi:phosphoglycolate phosphatase
MKQGLKFVLFDLDGTLCDSSVGIFRCFRYAFQKLHFPPPADERLKDCIGPPLLDSFLSFCNGDRKMAELGVTFYRERYAVQGWRECTLYPYVKECLAALSAEKTLALATSKPQPYAENILRNFAIDRYFSVVVGSKLDNSFDDKGEIVAAAMQRLQADQNQTAMVGDRAQDMVGAWKNGITPVGIQTGFAAEGELERAGAKYIVKDFFTLKELLSGL